MARYSLKQYEDALKDYDEALRLNPDNKLFQKNRSAALIASKRNDTKDSTDERDEIIEVLKTSIKEQKDRIQQSRKNQKVLLIILFWTVVVVLFALLISSHLDFIGLKITPNPLSILPIFSILGFIIMPIIWGLRITGQAIMQSSILEQDYFSRLHVMSSLDYYQSELGKDRNDLIIDHIKNWMNDNTADRMDRLYSKKTDAGKTPHEDMMKLCREEIAKLCGDILAKCTNITGASKTGTTKTDTKK